MRSTSTRGRIGARDAPPPPSREGGCVALDVISRPQLFAQLATGATAWCSPPLFA